MDIKLNFINRSNDNNNSEIVIFSQNVATNFEKLPVAWIVIPNCARGDNHPFVYPLSLAVGAEDAYGNYTPQLPASDGQLFAMTRTTSGDELSLAGRSSSAEEVQVENRLQEGAINALVYKDGRIFAAKTGVAPGQVASFRFEPKIWIGAASQATPGQLLNTAIMSSIKTEISLLGLTSADIVMTGGGAGPDAQPFEFHLENAV